MGAEHEKKDESWILEMRVLFWMWEGSLGRKYENEMPKRNRCNVSGICHKGKFCSTFGIEGVICYPCPLAHQMILSKLCGSIRMNA